MSELEFSSDGASPVAGPVFEAIDGRSSTRAFAGQATDEQRAAVLHAALRAPTAGNMTLYSIIDVVDPAQRERVTKLCYDQRFMMDASLMLVFVCDYERILDLFDYMGLWDEEGAPERRAPGYGEFMLAVQDAMCAAENAVIAAEALGMGSCYIGNVLDHAEEMAEVFGLPPHTVPLSLLVIGPKAKLRAQTPHMQTGVVMRDRYCRADVATMEAQIEEMDAKLAAHSSQGNSGARVRRNFRVKYATEDQDQMNASGQVWLDRWVASEPPRDLRRG
ncbi:MAG: nitroreductase family protein [Coriobacteriia bacterium]|nr:nitroreductase family protein [Coriobacteriia bacterium]MBS5477538.1 nitroreductase family protein [Coriobacteriia bacterium]